ncbi:AraC family ligand binding domain-containing protein [Pseudomonas stutzeri]|uniref:AraC family ligand binding domain-containing protein n=1 Tax=Stutzerimonas stutzeri TaxID=316 RepID=UPI001E30D40F|nr:AraC family ligand binding domain-containing protein [Stutzerimonas stutzeri]MCC8343201.1 AraC family ligand binding domain-containing protein [Stutzerimonas stutzeri]
MNDKDWVRRPHEPGRLERLEAYFGGYGFAPHRHDTYAIGCTLAGLHRFNYRKCARHSLPGDTFVLHPDELHDGEAGNEAGFRYRIVYIEPALLQGPLGGQPLPFIDEGVSRDPRLQRAISSLLQCLDRPLEGLEEEDALYDLAQVMASIARTKGRRRSVDLNLAFPASAVLLYLAVSQLRSRIGSLQHDRQIALMRIAFVVAGASGLILLLGPVYFWVPGVLLATWLLGRRRS